MKASEIPKEGNDSVPSCLVATGFNYSYHTLLWCAEDNSGSLDTLKYSLDGA